MFDTKLHPSLLPAAAIVLLLFDLETLPLLLLPIIVHEGAHIAVLKLCGTEISAFRADAGGLCIDYCGEISPAMSLLSAAAGPAAGIVYAYICSYIGSVHDFPALSLSAGISLLLSLFNLLPALPLDGGRMLEALLCRTDGLLVYIIGSVVAFSVILCGAELMLRGYGCALFIAGAWILLFNLRELLSFM